MAAIAFPLDAADVRTSGFPVYSLYPDEKLNEVLKLLEFDHSALIEDGVVMQTMHGLPLAWHYQPHAWSVRCGDMLTPIELFGDYDLLGKALARRRMLGNCKSESDLRKALRIFSGTQSVSNFRPTAAAAIYDRYLPDDGGVVWDMSAGFGGRLLGAFACEKVTKYIATDPATLTMDGLREMRGELLLMMQRLGYPAPEIQLHTVGSEDFAPEPESLSLCFTSFPYGSHERYSDEPTQSYIKFPTNEAWLNGYMRMTLNNCRIGLKTDGFLAVNIAGVRSYPTLHHDFVSLAEANGWRQVETLRLALSKMPGTGKQTASHKFEPVYVFRKATPLCVQSPLKLENNLPDPTESRKEFEKSTPPTFSYPGGKARMAKMLVEMMPRSGRRYVEPFAGRANVFWVAAGELGYQEWHLNDIRTAAWLEAIRDHGDRLVVPRCTRMEYYKRWADFKRGCPYARMLEPFLTYSGGGFGAGGFRTNEKGGSTQAGFRQSIQMAQHILDATGATITSIDWKEALAGLGTDDFVYFDPPYLNYDVGAYSSADLDHKELVQHLLKAPYRWILSEYDQPIYREAFGAPRLTEKAATRHGIPRLECIWTNISPPSVHAKAIAVREGQDFASLAVA